ncbi:MULTISPECIES: DUF6431 domain-containing protein [Bacillales]|uniref:DUF6431 domain-containing protein n=1 Tax=Bacillales TaxID=1385 RepID=UPI000A04593E|nr:DUF6431 domain-containing protein [Paenibacillus alginolyticus]MEC0148686.1 DUF6431 domain-containing protein [Paenibacillus alginolyticus]
MCWLRRSPAFFVRCAEVVPSPCCGEELQVIGSRKRISRNATGEAKVLSLRRLRCTGCCKIHHELPDCLVPYKRYESTCVEDVVSEDTDAAVVAADDSTLYRWKSWYNELATYWCGALSSIAVRFHQQPLEVSSTPSLSTHQRIGQIVGDAPGWLARVVRPIANVNLWLHTRSAFLSTGAFGRLSS